MSRVAAFAATIVCAASVEAQTAYFRTIPDLPVAPGLTETEVPSGFSEAHQALVLGSAIGPVSAESIERFYGASLSNLGWSYLPAPRDEGMTFVRGRERLALRVAPEGRQTRLHVRLLVTSAVTNAD